MIFSNRGPVGCDEQAVERPGAIEGGVHALQQRIERLGRDDAVRQGTRRKDWHRVELFFRQPAEEAADFVMGIGEVAPRTASPSRSTSCSKCGERGRAGDEGVRFLEQGDDADAHGVLTNT